MIPVRNQPVAVPGQLLRRAVSNWRSRSLLPYACLALTSSAIAILGIHFWQLPGWMLPANLAFVVAALISDRQWHLSYPSLCTRLDACYPQLQDSSQLLLSDTAQLSPMAALQQQRIAVALQDLLASRESKWFRPPHLRSPLLAAAGACLGLLVFMAMDMQSSGNAAVGRATAANTGAQKNAPASAVVAAETRVQPPAYTGLVPSTQTLDIQAPEQSRIHWNITLDAPAQSLSMLAAEQTFAFTPLEPLPSRRWQLTRVLAAPDFYQLGITRTPGSEQMLLPQLHNIDIAADRAPEFDIELPTDTVTVVNLDEDTQSPLFQVSVIVRDDYAVAEADLLLTLASGSGENVRFRNERIKLQARSGADRQKHFRFSIPVARYAIEPGDELYWYLEARDNRAPQANVQKSQHYILRWPQEEIFGLSDAEGMAVKVLPEYFRSQRQLIIDTETLIAEEPEITAEDFRKRAASLAYEQNLLRLRYGRFLGEEDSGQEEGGHGEAEQDHDTESAHGDDHKHSSGPETHSATFGDATGVVAAAGHQHDSSDHATLFDPKTRELLRSALNAMWSAWRELSVIEPRASLPHQHTALRYIKEVQQASRIYLQRVGFETPPLDESRRLSGEHEIAPPPRLESKRDDSERRQLLALLDRVQRGQGIDVHEEQSLRQLPSLRDDAALQMALAKELRRYQQQPHCDDCRGQLSALLYRLLPTPEARPAMPYHQPPQGKYSDWLHRAAEVTQ